MVLKQGEVEKILKEIFYDFIGGNEPALGLKSIPKELKKISI